MIQILLNKCEGEVATTHGISEDLKKFVITYFTNEAKDKEELQKTVIILEEQQNHQGIDINCIENEAKK